MQYSKNRTASVFFANYNHPDSDRKISGFVGGLFDSFMYDCYISMDICPVWRSISAHFLWLNGSIFLYGCSIDIYWVFISSLTENLGFAAGIAISVILFNYYSVSLAEHVSSTAFGGVIVLCIIDGILGVIICFLTKNEKLAYMVSFILFVITGAAYFIKPEIFEGLLPKLMKNLSLFERFYTFVSGVFDLTSIVYYFTVIVFFLFLTVQSLEKRRYN